MTPELYKEYRIYLFDTRRYEESNTMVCAMDDMGEYSNFFGALGDINVRYIDWIMSNLRPDMEMKNYYELLCNLYAELERKVTGCV